MKKKPAIRRPLQQMALYVACVLSGAGAALGVLILLPGSHNLIDAKFAGLVGALAGYGFAWVMENWLAEVRNAEVAVNGTEVFVPRLSGDVILSGKPKAPMQSMMEALDDFDAGCPIQREQPAQAPDRVLVHPPD